MRRAFAIALSWIGLPSAGHAAAYFITPFTIPGASSVSIAAVNDFGAAAGTYVSAAAPHGAGFAGKPGKTVTLPDVGQPPFAFAPVPTGIGDDGTVLVSVFSVGETFGYTWQAGTYQNQFLLDYGYYNLFPPFLGSFGHISYNYRIGDGLHTSCAGLASTATCLAPFTGGFPQIASTNRRSEIAGQYETVAGTKLTTAVFLGSVKKISPLLPAGATASSGGWLNDLGQVAGAYADAAGALHGFVYTKGSYASFDLPTAPTALTVQGIDLSGRVIGTYTDSARQHAFVFTHGAVLKLATFPLTNTVQVSISHFGHAIAMTATAPDGTAKSYLVRCLHGPGNC